MQVFDNMAFEEVQKIDIEACPERKQEILRIILQELNQMGYTQVSDMLQEEAKVKLDHTELHQLKDNYLNGEYETVLQNLDFEDEINRKLQYEIQKQLYIEIVDQNNYEQAVNLLRQICEVNEEEGHFLTKLIFLQNERDQFLKEMKIPLDLHQQRLELYLKSLNLVNFGEFSLTTQLDKIIEQSQQYQFRKCVFHNETTEVVPQSLLNDHLCNQCQIPQYNIATYSQFDNEIWIATFSNSGQFISCATKSHSIYIINNEIIHYKSKVHKSDINTIIFSQNEQFLYSGSNDCQIICFRVLDGEILYNLKEHQNPILCLQIQNEQLFSGGVDNWIGIWNYNNKQEYKLNNRIKSHITKNILFTEQYMIIQNAAIYSITLFENDHKYNKIVMNLQEQDIIITCAICSKGRYLVVSLSKERPRLHLWDLKTFQKIQIFSGYTTSNFELRCCFGGGRDGFICIGSADGKIYFYNKNYHINQCVIDAHNSATNEVEWNQTKNCLLSASDDKTLKIWSQDNSIQSISIQVSQQNINNLIQIDEEEEDYGEHSEEEEPDIY